MLIILGTRGIDPENGFFTKVTDHNPLSNPTVRTLLLEHLTVSTLWNLQ